MRVATFNVHHCEGRDGAVDPERIAQVIRSIDADVVALQELDIGMERTGGTNQPELLAKATGLTVEFHPLLQRGDGRYGIAIAARGPLGSARIHLPRLGVEEPRAAVAARWRDVTFIATHLSRSRVARVAQTEALARIAREAEPPVVLMGDLNATGSELGPLRDAGLRGPHHRPLRPLRRIDHVLAGRGLAVARITVVRSSASDHPAVVGELQAAP